MTWPDNPNQYQFTPWTDPNGIQWIYNSVKGRWARYRAASTGGVSSFNDLTDVPAALTTPQAAATPSIRAIGTGATDAAAGNHAHSEITIEQFGAVTFTGGVSGLTNIFADNVAGNYDVQMPNKGGTFAMTSDLGGTSNALVFGSGDEIVSMSLITGVASFTLGANAKVAFQNAIGATSATSKAAITAANAAALATAAGVGTTDAVTHKTLALTGGSIAVSSPNTITQTWTGTGTYEALTVNVTDTTSAAESTLLDLKVGGVSKFKVDKSGNATATSFRATINDGGRYSYLAIADSSYAAGIGNSVTGVGLICRGEATQGIVGMNLVTRGFLAFSSSTSLLTLGTVLTGQDTFIFRDAAGILAQRNTSNAQKLRVYGTTTGNKYAQFEHDQTDAIISSTYGAVKFATPLRPPPYTVTTAPATVATGMVTGAIITVTDALTPAIGSAVVTGGAQLVACQYSGAAWIVTAILT